MTVVLKAAQRCREFSHGQSGDCFRQESDLLEVSGVMIIIVQ